MKKVTVIWEVRPRLDQVFYATEFEYHPNGIVRLLTQDKATVYVGAFKELLVEEVEGGNA